MHIIAYQYKSQARSKQSPKDKSNSGHPGHNSCLFPKILVAILLGGISFNLSPTVSELHEVLHALDSHASAIVDAQLLEVHRKAGRESLARRSRTHAAGYQKHPIIWG